MDKAPRLVRRMGAHKQHMDEVTLLENFEVMHDVRLAILWSAPGEPDLDTWIVAAEEMGLTVAMAGEVAVFSKDSKARFLGFQVAWGAQMAVLP